MLGFLLISNFALISYDLLHLSNSLVQFILFSFFNIQLGYELRLCGFFPLQDLLLSQVSLYFFLILLFFKRHFVPLPLFLFFFADLLFKLRLGPLCGLPPLPLLQRHLLFEIDRSLNSYFFSVFEFLKFFLLGFCEFLLTPIKLRFEGLQSVLLVAPDSLLQSTEPGFLFLSLKEVVLHFQLLLLEVGFDGL